MEVFCPLCQEVVEIDTTTNIAYRLSPKRHKCKDCYPVTIEGIKGWRPVRRKGSGKEVKTG